MSGITDDDRQAFDARLRSHHEIFRAGHMCLAAHCHFWLSRTRCSARFASSTVAVALGGTADRNGRVPSATSVDNDPSETLAGHCAKLFQSVSKCLFPRMQCCSLSLGTDMWLREVMTLVTGTEAAWRRAARAQQPARSRKVGLLHPGESTNRPSKRPGASD